MSSGVRRARYYLPAICVMLVLISSGAVAEDRKGILGVWHGTSVCVNREAAPACRNEEVIYEFREMTPPVVGRLAVKADKVVEGKIVPMGVLDVVWDPGSETWSCDFQTSRVHGLWSHTQRGDELAGTLISLPDRTLLRKATARRWRKAQSPGLLRWLPVRERRLVMERIDGGRMSLWILLLCAAVLLRPAPAGAQKAEELGAEVRKYVRVSTPRVILEHVRVIDGTGAAAVPDQNITIERGKIAAISAGADAPASAGTTILDLRGYSVMPGVVGMHDHLFDFARPNLVPGGSFDAPALFQQMTFSAPRLYLANGVTTARTVGSIEPQTDLRLKQAIEAGVLPGPHLDVTGPYLEGTGDNPNLQMRQLTGPEDARQTVAYWADRGVTSFKAYKHITREELSAAVKEAHRRGLKVTGHLCSVTYEEAAEIGIDNLEHGFFVNTGLDPDKKPDKCSSSQGDYTLEHMTPGGVEANRLIATLREHHVAITSTLVGTAAGVPVPDASVDGLRPLRPAALEAMAPSLRDAYIAFRNRPRSASSNAARLLRRDMDLERAFVAAGGLLLAGPDPGGIGGNLPGFGDHREIELLVEAGFSPVQAIRIATLNGAIFLGRQDWIGSIAVGKNADLVVLKGDPATSIADIENIEIVFQDGVGYDTNKLLASVKGRYGEY